MAKLSPHQPSVLDRWARLAHRRRGRVILAWVLLLAFLVFAVARLGQGFETAFSLPGSESQRAIDVLKQKFPARAGDIGDIVFEAPAGIADPAIQQRIDALLAEVKEIDGVAGADSPYSNPSFINKDGTIARAPIRWNEQSSQLSTSELDPFVKAVDAAGGNGLRVETGGRFLWNYEQPAFGSEGVGVLAAIVILLIAFGSVWAMGLPVLAALFGIAGGAGVVALLTNFFAFPDFTTQFIAMIGIGVGIDYSLLVVTRFREGIHRGLDVEESVALAVTTAGRSVLFAGIVVAIAFFGLWAMGIPFIAALGTGTAIGVAVAVLVSLTLMPALLSLVGYRIDKWKVPFLHSTEGVDVNSGWYRMAKGIQRRPLPYAAGAVVLLLALGAPVLAMRVGFTDAGNNAERYHTRRAYDLLSKGFGPGFNGPLLVVLDSGTAKLGDLSNVQSTIAGIENVVGVLPPVVSPDGTAAVITLFPGTSPQDGQTTALVHRLRGEALPALQDAANFEAFVTGGTASSVDIQDRITERMPFLFLGVIGLSFLLLTVVFRSIVVALKAAIMNMLSIGAAYGVVVAVFQWGWGANIIGVEKGPIEVFMPMMFFAILFGLSMDYEVFLISRIREIYARTGDTASAVAEGLAATARVITAAAAIMVAVFLAFVLGEDRVVKMIGLGLATAIFVDATVVRLVLVPATMELLGKANWWLPGWLDRVLPEVHIEGPAAAPREPSGAPAGGK